MQLVLEFSADGSTIKPVVHPGQNFSADIHSDVSIDNVHYTLKDPDNNIRKYGKIRVQSKDFNIPLVLHSRRYFGNWSFSLTAFVNEESSSLASYIELVKESTKPRIESTETSESVETSESKKKSKSSERGKKKVVKSAHAEDESPIADSSGTEETGTEETGTEDPSSDEPKNEGVETFESPESNNTDRSEKALESTEIASSPNDILGDDNKVEEVGSADVVVPQDDSPTDLQSEEEIIEESEMTESIATDDPNESDFLAMESTTTDPSEDKGLAPVEEKTDSAEAESTVTNPSGSSIFKEEDDSHADEDLAPTEEKADLAEAEEQKEVLPEVVEEYPFSDLHFASLKEEDDLKSIGALNLDDEEVRELEIPLQELAEMNSDEGAILLEAGKKYIADLLQSEAFDVSKLLPETSPLRISYWYDQCNAIRLNYDNELRTEYRETRELQDKQRMHLEKLLDTPQGNDYLDELQIDLQTIEKLQEAGYELVRHLVMANLAEVVSHGFERNEVKKWMRTAKFYVGLDRVDKSLWE